MKKRFTQVKKELQKLYQSENMDNYIDTHHHCKTRWKNNLNSRHWYEKAYGKAKKIVNSGDIKSNDVQMNEVWELYKKQYGWNKEQVEKEKELVKNESFKTLLVRETKSS